MAPQQLFHVDLFYDLMSPYSFVAFETLSRLERSGEWPIKLSFRPVHIAALFKESGNRPPIFQSPLKGPYLYADLQRAVKHYCLPTIRMPENFAEILSTKSSLNAMRVLLAVEASSERAKLPEAIRLFYHRFFHEQKGIFTDEDFREVLTQAKVNAADAVILESKQPQFKQQLIENTKMASSYNAFGAPWIVVHTPDGKEECFFGSDRLPYIADLIGVPFDVKAISKL